LKVESRESVKKSISLLNQLNHRRNCESKERNNDKAGGAKVLALVLGNYFVAFNFVGRPSGG
jgi:hypothetical protein